MSCESTTRAGSLSPGGAWRRSQSPRNENSRLTTSNRLARRTRLRARCIAGTVTSQPLEAPGRGQGPELQQPLGEALPTVGVGDQHHLAAVGLHGSAALLGVELIVDQHHCRQVVASRQLGHQPMHPRLGAKAWRAGRHLGDAEDTEALWAHRSGPDKERLGLDVSVGARRAPNPGERPGLASLADLKPYVTLVG